MIIQQRGIYPINIGGKDLEVRFKASVCAGLDTYLEERHKKPMNVKGKLMRAFQEAEQNMGIDISIDLLTSLILFGLSHEQKKIGLTRAKIETWLDADEFDMEDVAASIFKAYVSGMPGGKKYMDLLNGVEAESAEPEAPKKPAKKAKK